MLWAALALTLGASVFAARLPAQDEAAQFRQGRWQTPDGQLLVLQITPPDSSTDAARNQNLLAAAQAVVQELAPRLIGVWAIAPFLTTVHWRGHHLKVSAGTRLYAMKPAGAGAINAAS